MFAPFKVYAAIITVLNFLTVLGNENLSQASAPDSVQAGRVQEVSQVAGKELWLNPNLRCQKKLDLSVPALVAAVGVGTMASFINWVTLRGNLSAIRHDLRKPLSTDFEDFAVNRQNLSAVNLKSPVEVFIYDHAAWKKSLNNNLERVLRHRNFSILRRTATFKALTFGLPAFAAYHAVEESEQLKVTICENLGAVSDYCKNLKKS